MNYNKIRQDMGDEPNMNSTAINAVMEMGEKTAGNEL